jgi:hypothetical protein
MPVPPGPAVRVRVTDLQLRGHAAGDAVAIGRTLTTHLGSDLCLAGAVDQRRRRVRISFNAAGQTTKVELLDATSVGHTRVRRLPPGGGSSWVIARRGGGRLHHRRHRAGAVRRRILAAIRPLAKTG